ncbi:hypothetical protein COLO4_25320 [Corchorus olitorius]|uniref:Uncharacterized protein n=1 Tax=Corchorus olitorius TaxID=93759 RepID=A0A1R3I3Q7_9ROSI|nr:hypothetical protein COLO4_25320 [Corchorus olitorius]
MALELVLNAYLCFCGLGPIGNEVKEELKKLKENPMKRIGPNGGPNEKGGNEPQKESGLGPIGNEVKEELKKLKVNPMKRIGPNGGPNEKGGNDPKKESES